MSWLLCLAFVLPTGGPDARLEVAPGAVEVGTPVAVELVARAPLPAAAPGVDALAAERSARADLRLHFGEDVFEEGALDYSWLLFDAEPLVIRRALGEEQAAELVARRRFRLVSLEPGERSLPLPAFEGELEPVTRTFTGLLAEDEDTPRPLLGFRPLPDEVVDEPLVRWPLVAIGGTLVAMLAGLIALRRRRRRKRLVGRDPKAEIAGLAGDVKAAHFALTALLREAFDAELEAPGLPGATDAEWLAERRDRLGLDAAANLDLERLFEACSEVKYGGASATEWGLAERTERALALLERGGTR